MAGNYPDVPSWRIPWDKDGSIVVVGGGEQGVGVNQAANDESGSGALSVGYGGGLSWQVIFSRLLDIDAWFVAGSIYGSYGGFGGWSWSPNTTSGTDGDWYSFPASWQGFGTNYRTNIQSGTYGGVRALQGSMSGATGGTNWVALHVYGEYTAGQDTNHVEIWHPTLNNRVDPAYFDWGNVPRSSTEDRQFRVKNLSPTLTANDVRLSFDTLTDGSPSVPGQHFVSEDGLNFYAQRTISAIGPLGVSPIYTVRRVTPSNAQFALFALRINAEPLSWS